jgi:hypothetical protein
MYIDNEKKTCAKFIDVGSSRETLYACRSLVALDKIYWNSNHAKYAYEVLKSFVHAWYLDEKNFGTFLSMGYSKPNGTYLWTPYDPSDIPDYIRIFRGELSFANNGTRVRSRTPPPIRSGDW